MPRTSAMGSFQTFGGCSVGNGVESGTLYGSILSSWSLPFAAELARGYHERRYSFEFCDRVVNVLSRRWRSFVLTASHSW